MLSRFEGTRVVYLHRIYTRGGDGGDTSLGDGARISKSHPRISAYGTVEELNAALGVAVAAGVPEEICRQVQHIQHDLFDVGADLCVPEPETPPESPQLRVVPRQVETLERWIDEATEVLEPLTSFVLPGGSIAAAHLHHARTIRRRAEIGCVELASLERINPEVITYLNRLSDLLFVLARMCNDRGRSDVLWERGRNR